MTSSLMKWMSTNWLLNIIGGKIFGKLVLQMGLQQSSLNVVCSMGSLLTGQHKKWFGIHFGKYSLAEMFDGICLQYYSEVGTHINIYCNTWTLIMDNQCDIYLFMYLTSCYQTSDKPLKEQEVGGPFRFHSQPISPHSHI